ncbi:MAG: hypothetical protein ACHWZW_22790 [Spirulina sp.]
MFVRDLSGILMKIEENEVTRYRYELWFDYTRQAMNTIAEGAMLAVPNFASDQQQTRYSILEVTGILPMHYALGTDTGGYPGFITEAARNAGKDWITQDTLSTEDTTKIRCIAVPTNLEVVEVAFSPNNTGPRIQIEAFIDDYNEDPANKKAKKSITATAQTNLDTVIHGLKAQAQQSHIDIPPSVTVSIPQIVEWLNDDSQSSLIIVQSHNPDDLRDFAAKLAHVAYESRRRTGQITPLVSFIFDEADEFIPGKSSSDSQKHSKAAVMTLARRGRKFGLGIGISTQRIANLDVNTLAQPHTYFVSKLPREYDRRAIAEAFGISEDMFRQTFKFKKGDWLLASYDATGLEALPIPIHTEDANRHILDFVEQHSQGHPEPQTRNQISPGR